MENINENRLYHLHLVRLNDELEEKLMNHIEENDTTIAGTVRQSLRKFFNVDSKKKTASASKPEEIMEQA